MTWRRIRSHQAAAQVASDIPPVRNRTGTLQTIHDLIEGPETAITPWTNDNCRPFRLDGYSVPVLYSASSNPGGFRIVVQADGHTRFWRNFNWACRDTEVAEDWGVMLVQEARYRFLQITQAVMDNQAREYRRNHRSQFMGYNILQVKITRDGPVPEWILFDITEEAWECVPRD